MIVIAAGVINMFMEAVEQIEFVAYFEYSIKNN